MLIAEQNFEIASSKVSVASLLFVLIPDANKSVYTCTFYIYIRISLQSDGAQIAIILTVGSYVNLNS